MTKFKIAKTVGATLIGVNFLKSFIDNTLRTRITEPQKGSVIYCDMFFGRAEHSGIFIDENNIVELDGSGEIQLVSPKQFITSKNLLQGTAMSIYVSCNNKKSVGSELVAQRALAMVGQRRNYNFLLDNCHQFCCGCLTGEFNNNNKFLWQLKKIAKQEIQAKEWRIWSNF